MTRHYRGYLSLILTAHVPYLRSAGREPEGEDALHETIAASIVPVLNVIADLHERGLHPPVALAYSPVLLEQLADNVIQKHFVVWMERWLTGCVDALRRWEQQGDEHRAYLARFYLDWGQGILHSFVARYGRNLVAALRDLCVEGLIEPLAGAATHAYLPLVGRAEALRAQLDVGTLSVTRLLGRRPRGLWLPECGFRAGLELPLRFNGTRYCVVDPSSVAAGVGVTHLRPRWVLPRRLTALIRDVQAAEQVAAPELGYVGDPLYRAPQRDPAARLGLWRNGSLAGEPGAAPELYDPYHAFRRAQEHAAHFAAHIAAELEGLAAHHDRPGLAVVPLEAELLGRRWFEGPTWLRALLELTLAQRSFALATPAPYLRGFRPRQGITLRDGSWGPGGDHRAWERAPGAPGTAALERAEVRLIELARQLPDAHGVRERLLNQALRELLLAQASDWPLLAARGADEALRRIELHTQRCERLCTLAASAAPETALDYLEQLEEIDNPFPHLNYRVVAAE